MMLTGLANVSRKAGLRTVECAGWKTRGHGEMSGVRTVTCHHTANGGATGNYPSLRVVRDGRPGLDGPLAQLGLGLDGTVYVIAAGRCYHAGVSRHVDYTNSYAVGIEAEARGTGWSGDWPPAQLKAFHRLCKALVIHYSLDIADVRGHKETCSPLGRKIDPTLSMTAFRTATKAVNLNTSTPGDDVDLSKRADAAALFNVVWRGTIPGEDVAIGGEGLDPAQRLTRTERLADEIRDDVNEVQATLGQITLALQQLSEQVGKFSTAPQ